MTGSVERAGSAAYSADAPLARLLDGRSVLVPRGGPRGERIATLLAEHGASAELVPLIEQVDPEDLGPLTAAVAELNRGAYAWVAVTSEHGARALVAAGARPGTASIAAVGPVTAAALTAAGFTVDLVPDEFTGAKLAAHLVATIRAETETGARVLLPLSEIAEPTLEEGLRAAGLSAERVTAYRTVPVAADRHADAALSQRIGAALVLSSSGARALAARFAPLPHGTVVAAIGEPTARELARVGLPADTVASEHTAAGTVAALVDFAAADRADRAHGAHRADRGPIHPTSQDAAADAAATEAHTTRSTSSTDPEGTAE